jgi:hypothetical protein
VISGIRVTPKELKIVLFGKGEIDDADEEQRAGVLFTGSYDGRNGSPGRTRTCDMVINSHPLYQLSY